MHYINTFFSQIFLLKQWNFTKLHEYYYDLYQKYGPIVKEETLFNIPVISIFSKDDIEKVLRSGEKYPIRPPTAAVAHFRRSRPDRYASTGLVNEQGKFEPIFLYVQQSTLKIYK